MPNDYTQTLGVVNLIFAGIFTLEALLKLSVFGVWGYFQQAGNIFDFVIVVATLFGIFMDLIGADLGSAATVIRTIRILRVVRLFNGFKELKIIVDAIGFAIPYVLNILVLLFLIVSIFSVLFMQVRRVSSSPATTVATDPALPRSSPLRGAGAIGSERFPFLCAHTPSHALLRSSPSPAQIFGKVGFNDNGIDVHANFQDFPTAAVTLMRIAMGEGWPDILMDLRWGPGTSRGSDLESQLRDALFGPIHGCTVDPVRAPRSSAGAAVPSPPASSPSRARNRRHVRYSPSASHASPPTHRRTTRRCAASKARPRPSPRRRARRSTAAGVAFSATCASSHTSS